jgi:hypothetical protein
VGRGGLANFEMQHRPGISKACQLALKKKSKADAHQRSQPHLQAFFTKQATPLVPPMVPVARRVVAYAIELASTGPRTAENRSDQSLDQSHASSATPDEQDVIVISESDDTKGSPSKQPKETVSIAKRRSTDAPASPCPGYKLTFPPGQQAHMLYPYGLHSILTLPWDYRMHHGDLFLWSNSCTGKAKGNIPCNRCEGLSQNKHLQKIVARYTTGAHENTSLVYHGVGGLIDIVHHKTSEIDHLRLHRLNDVRKLV